MPASFFAPSCHRLTLRHFSQLSALSANSPPSQPTLRHLSQLSASILIPFRPSSPATGLPPSQTSPSAADRLRRRPEPVPTISICHRPTPPPAKCETHLKRQRQSRPFSSTETAQNLRKTAVSSLLRHRDRTTPRKNSSLVPSQAPRPHKIPEKQQSRPLSSTETTQNLGKTAVSSHPKHRERTKPRKSSSLVPSPTPGPLKTPEKQQSRPISDTETTHNPGKAAVSSHLRHRDRTKPQKSSSLVPSPAPTPLKTTEKQQSRPLSSTETTHYGR